LHQATKIVKQAYSVLPDYDKIISAMLTDGVWLLPKTCNFTPGIPVEPMLSEKITGVSEALSKLRNAELICEYKYDGERAQVMLLSQVSLQTYIPYAYSMH